MKIRIHHVRIASLILSSIIIFHSKTTAQPDITFHVDNLYAGPAQCNWMFETDDPNTFSHDGNPFTFGGNINVNNFAYWEFTWENGVSSGICSNENTDIIDGAGGITLKLYDFFLNSFSHVNTVNANNNWEINGQAGDERMYVGGIGEIWNGANLVLRATNCRLSVTTPYPTAAQMNFLLGPNRFINDVGSGAAVTGSGWGVIDNESGVQEWKDEFDPNHTGQLEFEISTISSVIQTNYGYYDFDIKVKPTVFVENLGFNVVPAGRNTETSTTVDIAGSDVSFNINSATSGNGGMRTILANQILTNPGGSAPSGIEKICPQLYWQLGTTLESYSIDVTFNISDITGITNPENLRILKRTNSSADWAIYENFTLSDATHIKANALTSFSEFAIGSTGTNPLPVELQSFSGSFQNNSVILNWMTATEVNNYGFEVERTLSLSGERNLLTSNWQKIGFVECNGNSNSTKNYSFVDKEIINGNFSYRLKQIDTDGSYSYSNIVEVTINTWPLTFELFQNYPNPFNPATTIKYSIPSHSALLLQVSLKIFDILGNEVVTLVNESKAPGVYEIEFSASGQNDLPSGIYFYSLKAGEFCQTRKMLFIK